VAYEQETEAFYKDLTQTVQKQEKIGECLIIMGMGDFNRKEGQKVRKTLSVNVV
jgi:hypothetical protein